MPSTSESQHHDPEGTRELKEKVDALRAQVANLEQELLHSRASNASLPDMMRMIIREELQLFLGIPRPGQPRPSTPPLAGRSSMPGVVPSHSTQLAHVPPTWSNSPPLPSLISAMNVSSAHSGTHPAPQQSAEQSTIDPIPASNLPDVQGSISRLHISEVDH